MKKSTLVTSIALMLVTVSFAQVNLNSSTGRVKDINTDFSFRLTDKQYDRILLESGWLSGIGDYLSIKHGGGNTETNTYGIRISDGAGFDFGKNNFSTSFLKIKTNGFVGIGTTNPTQKFEIYNSSGFNTAMENQSQDHISLISNDPGNGNYFGGITWKSGGRRRASISATREHVDSDYVGIAFFTQGTDGPGPFYESMRITRYGNVGIGTTAPDAKLTVKGNIHTQEVKVDLNGAVAPDYVFLKDYKLKSINEVETYIKSEGHLPNIPSAAEMEENGIELKQMNLKLLEKIEELTLYSIAQEKKLTAANYKLLTSDSRLQTLENKIKELESRDAKIKALEEKLEFLLKRK